MYKDPSHFPKDGKMFMNDQYVGKWKETIMQCFKADQYANIFLERNN
jgi:hypothetical protein